MITANPARLFQAFGLSLILLCSRAPSPAAEDAAAPKPPATALADALPAGQWHRIEVSVDRALTWLASRQAPNGSFPSLDSGQPAVTSLCVLAFLSRGHQPGVGPYGDPLNRAIDFVLGCQMEDGLFSYRPPEAVHANNRPSHTAAYNHAIAGLMLGEVYGQVSGPRARQVQQAIEKALLFTRELQTRPKAPADEGGWRYLRMRPNSPDSDMSVTGWQLMFLRSAKNAEFDVPQQYVEDALGYVRRSWGGAYTGFYYSIVGHAAARRSVDPNQVQPQFGIQGRAPTRGLTGAGILCLSLGGEHQTPMARSAGDWLLAHPFSGYGQRVGDKDRFFYSAYYCSQAAAQLGGRYWEGIFPPLAEALLQGQLASGAWPPEPAAGDAMYGNLYSTALALLSLTPPYQLLPVYQR